MRKSDGTYTYFVPDVAYHIQKFQRGFDQAINVQGSDHHGTIARVRAGLQAVDIGIPQGYPDYVLHKMVTVMKNGEEVKISKRAGSYVTVRDLIEWSGNGDVDARPRRGALLPHLAQGRHRVRVRRRRGAGAQRREPGVLRAVRPCAHLLGAGATGAATKPRLADVDLSPLTAPHEPACWPSWPSIRRCCSARWPNWARTRSRSTCANWPANCTATTSPNKCWSTTTSRSSWRAWRWSRPPARCCATAWP